ncbi:MAG: hypothetical protein ACOC5E_03210, partial [Acidobacteriota bacterium]
ALSGRVREALERAERGRWRIDHARERLARMADVDLEQRPTIRIDELVDMVLDARPHRQIPLRGLDQHLSTIKAGVRRAERFLEAVKAKVEEAEDGQ